MHISDSTWKTEVDRWTSLSDASCLQRIYPPPLQRISLVDALGSVRIAADSRQLAEGKIIQADLQSLITQLNSLEHLSRCPIVGITGQLNAGKSSLLATYLGTDNRSRVLRGVSNQAGTHRFVLWLPQRWRQIQELWESLQAYIARLFGNSFELLSEDPLSAAQQYNGTILDGRSPVSEAISVPLVAFDENLDALELGLLDCPDIQSPSQNVDRRDWLSTVSRLCSAFILVCRMKGLHDSSLVDILALLRDHMPDVPRFIAVNRVKARYTPAVVAGETQSLVEQYGVNSVYLAYDYRSMLAESVVPPLPQGLQPNQDGTPHPVFFLARADQPHLPADKGREISVHEGDWKYLLHLTKQLDVGKLASETRRSLLNQFTRQTHAATQWIERNREIRQQQIELARQLIADACYRFMAERDAEGKFVGLRLQASPAVVEQLADSLRRTAPIWLRPSLSLDRTARQLQKAIAHQASRLTVLSNVSQAVQDLIRRFRSGEGAQVVSAVDMAMTLRDKDTHEVLRGYPQESLVQACERALQRFSQQSQPTLDADSLDQWSQQIWHNMSLSKKLSRGLQPLALATGPLLAAILIPFDGGGTTVLVFASAQELMAAAGMAAVVTATAGGGQAKLVVAEEIPWRQLSDLAALLCDSLAIARANEAQLPVCGSRERRLFPSSIETHVELDACPLELWDSATVEHNPKC